MTQTLTIPTNPALYLRLSKREKRSSSSDTLAIVRQRADGLALGKRLGWGEPTEYVDDGHSAWTGAPVPDYERMIDALTAGEHDGILIGASVNRLTRQVAQAVRLRPVLEKRDIVVVCAWGESFDLGTAGGKRDFFAAINGAEYESSWKSEATKRARQQAVEDGRWHGGGQRHYGFTPDGVTHHPTEAPALRKAIVDILEGASTNSIADRLGVSKQRLRYVLTSPKIVGLRVHHGEVVGKGPWEPIIDEASWELLQAVMHDPSRLKKRPARRYLLTGVLYDTKGRKMFARPNGRPGKPAVPRYMSESPNSVSINAEPVEDIVVKTLLRGHVRDAEPLADEAEATRILADIAAAETAIAELEEAKLAEEITLAQFTKFKKPYVERAEALRRALPVSGLAPKRHEDFWLMDESSRRACWDEMTFAQQRELLADHIKRVVIAPATPGSGCVKGESGRSVDRSRVIDIEWR